MNITPRQSVITALLPPCRTAADIGCDHGRLGAHLLLSGKTERVIFSDISRPSLNKAITLINTLGLSERCDFRLGDGLTVLAPGDAQCAVIAGIGGKTIIEIINARPFSGALVLQPMSSIPLLKQALLSSGYAVTNDAVTREGRHFYEILLAVPGQWNPQENDLLFPMYAVSRRDPDVLPYLQHKADLIAAALSCAPSDRLSEKLAKYQEVIKCLL